MGDISVEPSMEDILSSIKRIIAEDGDAAAARHRRPQRPPAPRVDEGDDIGADEVLELNDPMPQPLSSAQPVPEPTPPSAARREPTVALVEAAVDPIVSSRTAAATRGSLDVLSRLMVKPEPGSGDGTLEGLVREMLRPMLREWLDANLPAMVETMVAREIAKITGQQG